MNCFLSISHCASACALCMQTAPIACICCFFCSKPGLIRLNGLMFQLFQPSLGYKPSITSDVFHGKPWNAQLRVHLAR